MFWRASPTEKNIRKIESNMDEMQKIIQTKLRGKSLDMDDLHNGVIGVVYKNSNTILDRRRFCKNITVQGLQFRAPNLKNPKKFTDYLLTPL